MYKLWKEQSIKLEQNQNIKLRKMHDVKLKEEKANLDGKQNQN